MSAFKDAYEKLNPEQRQAVDTIEGPVMVIAGPGTGKTQILTLRIANILQKTDIPADAILALTFTESAAANMRKRLVSMIGSRGYYVTIGTFHGFCNRVIQEHPERFEEILGRQNASQVDQIGIIRSILDDNKFETLKPFGEPYFFVPEILKAMRDVKNEGITAKEFETFVAEERRKFGEIEDLYHGKGPHKGKMKGEHQKRLSDIEKNEELAKIYELYQKELARRKLYDFEDMILEVIRALETKEEFLLELQEKYQYILVDEHQDTNGAQNKVLTLLASFYSNPNLFVVGDEKQAIFRFQGASLENFLFFQKKYPDVKLVQLAQNYRSTQPILDSAQSVIEKNSATIPAPLAAQSKHGTSIRIVPVRAAEAETVFLAEKIKEKLADGVPAREIAVIYRENRDAFPIADHLIKNGIPVSIESDQNVLADPDIQKILLLLRAVDGFGRDELLIEALHIDFLKVDPLDLYRLIEKREHRGISVHRYLARAELLAKLELEKPERLAEIYERMKKWKVRSRNEHFLQFFESLITESGFLSHLMSLPGYFEKMEKLGTLFDEIRKASAGRNEYRIGDFIAHLEILRDHGVMIRARVSKQTEAVRLMTAHKAKGLEFDAVFIVNACDGHWGNKRNRSVFRLPLRTASEASLLEKNEDERRIFYMAITRARKEVFISYAEHGADGREQVPSQFIEEIREDLRTIEDGGRYDEKFVAERESAFAPRRASGPTLQDELFLKELFMKRGLSVTALNNYLECPWRYFYNNLVRIPQAPSRHQSFGTAVHGALQDLFEHRKNEPEAGEEFLVRRFDYHLDRQPLSARDRELVRAKGGEVLRAYYRNYEKTWNWNALTEFKVQAQLTPEILLRGNLDKLEMQSAPGEVVVVDYKSRAPRSRNWIEGKTADSTGNYKRQLVFYRLLLELHPEHRFRMKAGVIDFIEPNERGKFKQEAFEIGEDEVIELKALIEKTVREILSLSFWNRRCGEKDCEYCKLRDLMADSPASPAEQTGTALKTR